MLEPIQIASSITAVISILLMIKVIKSRPDKKDEYLGWMFWLIHTVIYYLALNWQISIFIGRFGDWGAILRFHGYLTLLGYMWYKVRKYGPG